MNDASCARSPGMDSLSGKASTKRGKKIGRLSAAETPKTDSPLTFKLFTGKDDGGVGSEVLVPRRRCGFRPKQGDTCSLNNAVTAVAARTWSKLPNATSMT